MSALHERVAELLTIGQQIDAVRQLKKELVEFGCPFLARTKTSNELDKIVAALNAQALALAAEIAASL